MSDIMNKSLIPEGTDEKEPKTANLSVNEEEILSKSGRSENSGFEFKEVR